MAQTENTNTLLEIVLLEVILLRLKTLEQQHADLQNEVHQLKTQLNEQKVKICIIRKCRQNGNEICECKKSGEELKNMRMN